MTKARVVGVIVVLLCAMSQGVFAAGVVNTQPNLHMTQSVSLVDFQSEHGVRFMIDLLPASFLSSPDIEGFKLTRTIGSVTETETIDDDETGSWMPNVRGGLSFDAGPALIEPTVGAGYLINHNFATAMLMGDLACRFKLGDAVTLGPHIGVISFGDSTWYRDDYADHDDIDIEGSGGLMTGLGLTVGGETVAFSCSVDYISAEFDVETRNGWTANRDELDISGWAVNLGLAFKF